MLPVNHILIPLHAIRGFGAFGVFLDEGQLKFPTIQSDSQVILTKDTSVVLSPAGIGVSNFGNLAGIRTLSNINHQGNSMLVHMAMMGHPQREVDSVQWVREGELNSMICKGEFTESSSLAAYSLFLLRRAEFGSLLTK